MLLALNPNGKVPAALIEHPAPAGGGAAPPDVALSESGAIASFYLDTYDTEHLLLPPARTNERAVFNVLSHWCTGTIDNLTSNSSPIGRSSSNARSPNPPREEATTWHGARTLRTPRISLHRGWPNSWAWVGAMGATGTFVDQRSPLLMLCPWSGTLSLIRGSSTFCATLRMRRRRRWWRAWRTTRSFFAAAATFNTDVGGPRGKSVPRPVQRLDRRRVFAQHSPTLQHTSFLKTLSEVPTGTYFAGRAPPSTPALRVPGSSSVALSGRAPVSCVPRSSFWSVSAPLRSVPLLFLCLFLVHAASYNNLLPIHAASHLAFPSSLFYSSYFRKRPPTTMATLAEKPATTSFMVPAGRRLSRMDSKTLRKSSSPGSRAFSAHVYSSTCAHVCAGRAAARNPGPTTTRYARISCTHVSGQFVTRSFRRLSLLPLPFCDHHHRLFLHRQQPL